MATSVAQSSVSGYSSEFLAAVNGTTKQASSMELSQERFLKLLTAQLKNQDPLNPMDNAQMTSQMAQISTVNGIEKLNATLEKMMSSSSEAQSLQAASMLGRRILVDGTNLSLPESGAAIGGVELDGAADRVKVTVKDAKGALMASVNLGAMDGGVQGFSWDGKMDAGGMAKPGSYKFEVEATRAGKEVKVTALQAAAVTGIVRENGGVSLEVANGAGKTGLVAMDKVRQIF